ncbi:F-box/LRR-repeat protein 4-like [Haliotis asinina]|uniref:F-box/LRR-repeat protein 4-like n=1 Tax=Haliotis asinina TaxID=109174 RepID=UPI0035323DDE
MDMCMCRSVLVLLMSVLVRGSSHTCLEELNWVPSSSYSNKKFDGTAKVSKTIKSTLECISFCIFSGNKVSVIYDKTDQWCTCHNLPLSSLTLANAQDAVAFGETSLPADAVDTWISTIIRESSHFSSWVSSYPATKMKGPPDFYPSYGNTQNAWCPGDRDSNQYVELGIPEAIYIAEIHIYEVFWAGGVESVSIRDSNSKWIVVWSTTTFLKLEKSRIFIPAFIPPDFKSNAIRIDLGLGATGEWSEFDAVRVVGSRTRRRINLV